MVLFTFFFLWFSYWMASRDSGKPIAGHSKHVWWLEDPGHRHMCYCCFGKAPDCPWRAGLRWELGLRGLETAELRGLRDYLSSFPKCRNQGLESARTATLSPGFQFSAVVLSSGPLAHWACPLPQGFLYYTHGICVFNGLQWEPHFPTLKPHNSKNPNSWGLVRRLSDCGQ